MKETTREALEASIVHWKAVAQAPDPRLVYIGCSSCALCMLFKRDDGNDCYDCPVMARTGLVWCKKTPYGAAMDALRAWQTALAMGNRGLRRDDGTAFRAAARAEIEFLESLRDPPAA
jgi:hypothetical protein